ncbi:MAG: hypothetical protein HYR51_06680 [Candidatus Rokubacteria bacterium]|nr:hypothetical protein [Candidatus Rokubacteria bacterium]
MPEGLDGPWWTLLALVAVAIVVLVGLVAVARGGRRSWAWAAAAFIFALVLSRFFGGSAEASESGGGASGEWQAFESTTRLPRLDEAPRAAE